MSPLHRIDTMTREHRALIARRTRPRTASARKLAPTGWTSEGTFEADPDTEQMLRRAVAQCNEGRTTPMASVLSELRDRE